MLTPVMRTLLYAMDVTVDGFIAHDDGTCAELSHVSESAAYRSVAAGEVDCVVTGRVAFDARVRDGLLRAWPRLRRIVVTRTLSTAAGSGAELLTTDVVPYIGQLKASAGDAILLAGGAELATTLMRHGLIDEVALTVHPVAFGSGISLFAEGLANVVLERREVVAGESGRLHVRYAVIRQTAAAS